VLRLPRHADADAHPCFGDVFSGERDSHANAASDGI